MLHCHLRPPPSRHLFSSFDLEVGFRNAWCTCIRNFSKIGQSSAVRLSYCSLTVRYLEFDRKWILTTWRLRGQNFLNTLTHQIWCRYFYLRPRFPLETKCKMAVTDCSYLFPITLWITRLLQGSVISKLVYTQRIKVTRLTFYCLVHGVCPLLLLAYPIWGIFSILQG